MDSFDAIVFVWLASAAVVTVIGYLRGRTEDAMTLGIFLGPLGVVLAFLLLRESQLPLNEASHVLPVRDSGSKQRVAVSPNVALRRAA
jgi:hypothetical protein